jgi:hypothetical protein
VIPNDPHFLYHVADLYQRELLGVVARERRLAQDRATLLGPTAATVAGGPVDRLRSALAQARFAFGALATSRFLLLPR